MALLNLKCRKIWD